MKSTLKVNSVINIIILIAAFTPFMPWVAIILGVWQFCGNLILFAFQAISSNKVLLLKARGWYTLVASLTLLILYINGDSGNYLMISMFLVSGICAIWYTVICQAELKNIKTKQAALKAEVQYQ